MKSNNSWIGAYPTCSGTDFPCEICALNSGDMSRKIKVITVEQANLCSDFPSVNTSVALDSSLRKSKREKKAIFFD